MNAFLQNLERWCGWAYLQGRKRDIDVESGRVHTAEQEGEGEMNREVRIDANTLPRVKQTAREKLLLRRPFRRPPH